MPKKISGLSTAATLVGTELLEIVQSAGNFRVLLSAIKAYCRKSAVTAVSSAGGVLTLDLSLGDYFTVDLTENITSIVITNAPGAGFGGAVFVRFAQDSTPRTVAWPASFRWEGSAPSVSTGSGAIDLLSLVTLDGGTTWDATLSLDRG